MPEMVLRMVVLPAPLAAQHGDDLARLHLQAHAADGLDRAVGALDVGSLSTGRPLTGRWAACSCASALRSEDDVVDRAQVGLDHAGVRFAPRAGVPRASTSPWFMASTRSRHLGDQRHVVLHHQHGDAQLLAGCPGSRRPCRRSPPRSGRTRARRAAAAWAGGTARAPAPPPCARRYGRPATERVAVVLQVREIRSPLRPSARACSSAARTARGEQQLLPEAGVRAWCAGRSAGSAARWRARTARCSERCRAMPSAATAVRRLLGQPIMALDPDDARPWWVCRSG